MTPLRIALVEFSPSGGLFQFALQMGEALAERGHRVELITGPDPEFDSRVEGLIIRSSLPTWHPSADRVANPLRRKIRRIWRAGRYVVAWALLVRHLRRTRPDVIQWSSWRFPIDGWMVAWIARRRWSSVMADVVHSPRPFEEQRATGELYKTGGLLRRSLVRAYRSLDVAFVLGERAGQEFRAAWPEVQPRLEVIPHGDESIFLRSPVPAPHECPPRALFFGTLTRYKGLDLLVDAFARVREERSDAELVIAGDVSPDIDIQSLQRRIQAVGGIDFLPGYVPSDEVADLVGSARVVTLPYRAVFQSGVAHLAHTFARPVVATDVGDLHAAIEDGVTGVLVPAGDVAAFASGLLELLEDGQKATQMGRRGQERMIAERSWNAVAERVGPIYEALARPARASS